MNEQHTRDYICQALHRKRPPVESLTVLGLIALGERNKHGQLRTAEDEETIVAAAMAMYCKVHEAISRGRCSSEGAMTWAVRHYGLKRW